MQTGMGIITTVCEISAPSDRSVQEGALGCQSSGYRRYLQFVCSTLSDIVRGHLYGCTVTEGLIGVADVSSMEDSPECGCGLSER